MNGFRLLKGEKCVSNDDWWDHDDVEMENCTVNMVCIKPIFI